MEAEDFPVLFSKAIFFYLVDKEVDFNKVLAQNSICIFSIGLVIFYSREENEQTQEDSDSPDLPPTAEDSETADTEVDGLEKEGELGIFQVLERLEVVTNMLTTR